MLLLTGQMSSACVKSRLRVSSTVESSQRFFKVFLKCSNSLLRVHVVDTYSISNGIK